MPSALLAALLVAAAAQQPVFRVDVRLVRILATVKDPAGGLVGSLNKEDFTVYDNGVPQELAVFERHTELPLSIALLVDTSLSTAKELRYELDSVDRFLEALFSEGHPEDAIALYSFSYDVTLVASFTRNRARLRAGLKQLRPEGGTSLYDAIYLAAQDLETREGRRVMILVTDGADTTSAKSFHQALEAAHRADAVIYAILVVPISSDAGRHLAGENALETLAAGTGGRVFRPEIGSALDRAFAEILRDLRTQYLLAYYPKNVPPSRDRFHRLEVKVSQPNLRVLARSGYYEESEPAPRRRR
ncbi:MAG: VWA domain-containing protein [Bryobacterales bacterium]|nr:VWA domain-containing protein [Bryobacteraceae bacterium]MDW8353816.1 VWA domain-containing protein [Bryobacterales bacterium]